MTTKGDIIYVENEFCRMAYVYTDDPAKVGTMGWHGPDQVCVEYIERPKPSVERAVALAGEITERLKLLRRNSGLEDFKRAMDDLGELLKLLDEIVEGR